MNKVIIILILISVITLNCQNNSIMQASDYSPLGKYYFRELIEAKRSSTYKGESETTSGDKIVLSVEGPDDIKTNNENVFVIKCSIPYGIANPNIFLGYYNFSLVGESGCYEVNTMPNYKYYSDSESRYKDYEYVDEESIKNAVAISFFVKTMVKFIPYIGQLLSFSELSENTVNLLNQNPVEWQDDWDNESNYDIYTIPKPRNVKFNLENGSEFKSYLIEIPVTKLKDGKLFLKMNFASTLHYDDGPSSNISYIFDSIIIPLDDRNMKSKINHITKSIDDSINLTYQGNNMINARVTSDGTDNIIHLNLTTADENFDINTAEISIVAPRNTLKVAAVPQALDENGNPVSQKVYNEALDDVILGWNLFFLGLGANVSGLSADLGGNPFSVMSSGFEGVKTYLESLNIRSFPDFIRTTHQFNNRYDRFILPPLQNNQENNSIDLSIPVEVYESNDFTINFVIKSQGWTNTNSQKERQFLHVIPIKIQTQSQLNNSSNTIGLLIDSSGSMSSNDPQDIRKQALKMIFSNRLSLNERIYIIDFDESARRLNQNAVNYSSEELCSAVDWIDSSGGTDIQSALQCMRTNLNNDGISSNSQVVLLSDGLDQSDYRTECEWYAQNNISVHTISLIGNSNEILLQDIAVMTNGSYWKASSPEQLVYILNTIFNMATQSSTLAAVEGNLFENDIYTTNFFNDSSETMTPLLTGDNNELSFTMTSPSGASYFPNSSNASWFFSENILSCQIDNPEIGQWLTDISAVEIPPEGIEFRFQTFSAAEDYFDLDIDQNFMYINFNLETNPDFTVDSLSIRVTGPYGIETELESDKQKFIPQQGEGNYIFKCALQATKNDGTKISRYLQKHIHYGNNPDHYFAAITESIGSKLRISLGEDVGLFVGLRCQIVRNNPQSNNLEEIGRGVIIITKKNQSIMKILDAGKIEKTDLVKPDMHQLIGD